MTQREKQNHKFETQLTRRITIRKAAMKTNLKFHAMSILMAELQKAQMWAVYQISLGQEMPNSVTKNDLIMIIKFLFKQLDWIEKEKPLSEPKKISDVAAVLVTDVMTDVSNIQLLAEQVCLAW